MFQHLAPRAHDGRRITWTDLRAAALSLRRQLFSRQGKTYARFLWRVVTRHREHLAEAIRLAIKGYHFERITRQQLEVDAFSRLLHDESDARRAGNGAWSDQELRQRHRQVRARIDSRFAPALEEAMVRFRVTEQEVVALSS